MNKGQNDEVLARFTEETSDEDDKNTDEKFVIHSDNEIDSEQRRGI
jgi:hypothetical protein